MLKIYYYIARNKNFNVVEFRTFFLKKIMKNLKSPKKKKITMSFKRLFDFLESFLWDS